MRLKVSESKNAKSLYVIKSVYNPSTKSNTSKVVEKLGTYDELLKKLDGKDPIIWAKEYIAMLNEQEKEEKRKVIVQYSQSKKIQKDVTSNFGGGYLFLQSLYHSLKLDKIVDDISDRYKFEYALNSILSRIVYARVLSPASKLSTFEKVKNYLEEPNFELHQMYRGLEVLAKESSFIQAQLYKNSNDVSKRNSGILYYDCTNFFFESEQADGIRQYGQSKENRPNPIVQMGLFMDKDGIPLAFHINPGNTNEQVTLQPLEKQIISDFGLSKFVVCTDAGLASQSNRMFNDKKDRAFVTTQSLKKLKKHLKQWALDKSNWQLKGSNKKYNLDEIDEEKYENAIFFKERWIKENLFEQKLVITYSIRYKKYQRSIRSNQINRADKLIEKSPSKLDKQSANSFKRFIKKVNVTKDGEIAEKAHYTLDEKVILNEMQYDGYYAICTNLDEKAETIAQINHRRWEIEESFRIMKSEFKARPVYLSNDDRIKAHFLTCFIALLIYRLLEKKLGGEYTCGKIIDTLSNMNFQKIPYEGYIPTYTRTDLTDKLHEVFGFNTDYEIVTEKNMKKILKQTKKR